MYKPITDPVYIDNHSIHLPASTVSTKINQESRSCLQMNRLLTQWQINMKQPLRIVITKPSLNSLRIVLVSRPTLENRTTLKNGKRKRHITWFNPPFSKNAYVRSNFSRNFRSLSSSISSFRYEMNCIRSSIVKAIKNTLSRKRFVKKYCIQSRRGLKGK